MMQRVSKGLSATQSRGKVSALQPSTPLNGSRSNTFWETEQKRGQTTGPLPSGQ